MPRATRRNTLFHLPHNFTFTIQFQFKQGNLFQVTGYKNYNALFFTPKVLPPALVSCPHAFCFYLQYAAAKTGGPGK